jgi:MFS family permease
LFFAGQGLSLIGTWLTRFAMGFATYRLGGTAWQMGLVAFFSQAPTSIIAPVAGVLVDRWDRHRVIVTTQIFAMLQSAALAAFALTGTMTVWHLMWLGAVQAVINAFDMPARQSFVRQMVADRADLPNAIALNSALVNGARMIGPVIATVLCAAVGFGWCFAIDAMSYVAVVASLLAMTVVRAPHRVRSSRVREELVEGLRYVNGYPFVRALLLLLAITCVFGGAYTALLPKIAEDSLHGGDHGLGWLMGSAGAGALCGAIYLARRTGTAGLEHVIAKCGLAMGIGLVSLELAPGIWAAVPMMFVVGLGLMVQWTSTNTLVQTLVDDDKLGRVMSLYAVAFFTGAPVGALIEGGVATLIGPIHTYALAGLGCLAASMWYRRLLPTLVR